MRVSAVADVESPGASEPAWRLCLLGTWHLSRSRRPYPLGAGGRRLLALLALRGTLERSLAAGVLWPDCSETQARGNLRATLSRLNRRNLATVLDPMDGALRLAPDVEVDVHELVATARRVLDGTRATRALTTFRVLDNTDLLPGWYDDWVLTERERLHHLRLHALERLSAQLADAGNAPAALEAAFAAVAVEPLRESAHRAVISSHLAAGNLVEARRQLSRLRLLLQEELGVEPSRLTLDLFT